MVLAHLLVPGERMTTGRVIGFLTGFLGIIVLMSGRGWAGAAVPDFIFPLAVLCGALCYAANSVMTRLLVKGQVLVASAATLLVATAVAVPLPEGGPWSMVRARGQVVPLDSLRLRNSEAVILIRRQ